MLAQANFVRLSRDDVQRLLVEQSPYGLNLKVDLSEFDEALLYYRGTGTIVREERNPWRLYLAQGPPGGADLRAAVSAVEA